MGERALLLKRISPFLNVGGSDQNNAMGPVVFDLLDKLVRKRNAFMHSAQWPYHPSGSPDPLRDYLDAAEQFCDSALLAAAVSIERSRPSNPDPTKNPREGGGVGDSVS
jgi:hypothetical protein